MSDVLSHRLVCMVSELDREAIDNVFHDHRFANKSEAIRDIIARGLATYDEAAAEPDAAQPAAKPAKLLEPGSFPDEDGVPLPVFDPNSGDPFHNMFVNVLTRMIQQTGKGEFTEAEILTTIMSRPNGQPDIGDIPVMKRNMLRLGWHEKTIKAGKGATVTRVYRAPEH